MARLVPIVFAWVLGAAAPAPAGDVRPNIVLFLVDDMGWQDTSVPFHTQRTPLNERYRTPNMERLAAQGMRFTNAYASAPVCTPTRTSIMTGQCPARTRITFWTLHKDQDTSAGRRDDLDPPAWNVNGLQPDARTLPNVLRSAGYTTIHVGKAHFGARDTSGADPTNLCFDINIAGHAAGGPASYYGTDHFTVAGREGKDPGSEPSVWDIPGLEEYHGRDIYLTEALAIEACDAIRSAAAEGKPFYLNFAPYAVHAPIMANRKYLDHYPDLDATEAAYATMIETMDAALGSIMDTVEDLGVADETIIIFSSDNGGLSAHARGSAPDGQTRHTHNAPLRSGKGSAYEGGTRVPTIIKWPGVIAGETVSDVPIITHDFYPTIIALAGFQADYGPEIDGRDLTPLLTGRGHLFDASRVLCWNQPHQWGASGPGIWPFTSIRDGDWKLIYFHAGRRFELYDLAEDIGESNDLAASRRDKVQQLAAKLDRWIEDTGAQLSIDKRTGREVERPGAAAVRLLNGGGAVDVRTSPVAGIGAEPGVIRRDPSDVILLGDLYHVFYTKLQTDDPIAPEGYHGTVWHATSPDDGSTWRERGRVIDRGARGSFDSTGAFTPNVVRGFDGNVYVYYTGVGDGFDNRRDDDGPRNRTAIGVARVELDEDGAVRRVTKLNNGAPVLLPSPAESGAFDSFRVDDASLVLRDGMYRLYYKGRSQGGTPRQTMMGLAVAGRPEGPFRKVNGGRPVQPEGHEVLVWDQGSVVASLVTNAGSGLYLANDGESFAKIAERIAGTLRAPGACRPELTDPREAGPIRWGLHVAGDRDGLHLERFEINLPIVLATEPPPTVIATPSTEDRASAAGWRAGTTWRDQHEEIKAAVRDLRPDIVLIGDSITQGWGGPGRHVGRSGGSAFDRWLADTNALNAGISGDRTQHVLWRLDQGMLDGHTPRIVCVMIGTNNLPHDSAAAIAAGIRLIADRITGAGARVLLVSVPPRGEHAGEGSRIKVSRVNDLVRAFAHEQGHAYVDIAGVLVLEDGRADPELMAADWVHLKARGYDVIGQCLRTAIDALLADSTPVPGAGSTQEQPPLADAAVAGSGADNREPP